MYYISLKFEAQEKFMEAMNLLDQYGIGLDDFGRLPNGHDVVKPKITNRFKQKGVNRHFGMSLKLGKKTTTKGMTEYQEKIYRTIHKILKAQEGGVLSRVKVSQLAAAETGIARPSLSPQITLLIRSGYFDEVK